jgi:hypothetical protein
MRAGVGAARGEAAQSSLCVYTLLRDEPTGVDPGEGQKKAPKGLKQLSRGQTRQIVPLPVQPSETIFKNSCVKGFARMGTSMGPAAFIAGVVMWASTAA